jgi:hypothetical protein
MGRNLGLGAMPVILPHGGSTFEEREGGNENPHRGDGGGEGVVGGIRNQFHIPPPI